MTKFVFNYVFIEVKKIINIFNQRTALRLEGTKDKNIRKSIANI